MGLGMGLGLGLGLVVQAVAPRGGLERVGVVGHSAADVAICTLVDKGNVEQREAVRKCREAELLGPLRFVQRRRAPVVPG